MRGEVRVRPVGPDGPLPPEARYHETTRTLNLAPPASARGRGLVSWVLRRIEAAAPRETTASG